jgi:glycosyltransferase involved in cell wall biosynthesis
LQYGFTKDQVVNFPFIFDYRRLPQIQPTRGDYIAFLGQHSDVKGWHLLSRIISSAPNTKFVGIFNPSSDTSATVSKFNLMPFLQTGQLQIREETWSQGAAMTLANANAVLNPSIWPTTTENVLMESIGFGKPFICFRTGVHAEYFQDRVNALVAEPGDIVGIAERIHFITKATNNEHEAIGRNAFALFNRLSNPCYLKDCLNLALKHAAQHFKR